MSYLFNSFLSTELTCIPQFIDKYVGKYYSNTAGNALTWVFLMWNVLHIIFDEYLDVLLTKMQFKLYARKRILKSLWNCGFYSTSFLYCIATIIRNNINILEYRKNLPIDGGPIPPHIVLGLGLFGTFFLHTFLWNIIKTGVDSSCIGYFILTFIPLITYNARRTELYLSIIGLLSFVHFMFNIVRCASAISSRKSENFVKGLLFTSFGVFIIIHIIMIPVFIIVPLIYSLIEGNLSVPLAFLTVALIIWWLSEIFSNPLYNFIHHWIYHSNELNKKTCLESSLNCCLFPPRDDDAFKLQMIRKEIKEREERIHKKRKPKSRGVLIQTLKYMVAIKRKLNKKRQTESSDSSESESDHDKAEPDSGSDESSSEENSDFEDEEKREAKQYKEETAAALLEDIEITSATNNCETTTNNCENLTENEDKKND